MEEINEMKTTHKNDVGTLLDNLVFSYFERYPLDNKELLLMPDFWEVEQAGNLCLLAHPGRAFCLSYGDQSKTMSKDAYRDFIYRTLLDLGLNGAEANYDYASNGSELWGFRTDWDYNQLTFEVLKKLAEEFPARDWYFTKGSDSHTLFV